LIQKKQRISFVVVDNAVNVIIVSLHGKGIQYLMKSNPQLEKNLKKLHSEGELVPRTENNLYLKISYCGTGKLISNKWNVKIYTSGSVVCNDMLLLKHISEGSLKPAPNLPLYQIDDAGVGFPICGVMVGVTDGVDVWTDVVDVSFFQTPRFEKGHYLNEYAKKGASLLGKLGVDPKKHRIEICTGYINTRLKDMLREKGFDVRVNEIKGLLQDRLEQFFREYVRREAGADLGYDPKQIEKLNLGLAYYRVVRWAKQNAPHLLKTGWGSLKNEIKR